MYLNYPTPRMATDAVDLPKLTSQLEEQELEAAGGVASPQVYSQLLALYLLQNDVVNAKYLWKRIPANVKQGCDELGHIWNVGQKMWQRDFAAIYEALDKNWSDNVKQHMNSLGEATRKRAFNLIAQAYSSINGDDFAKLVGMPVSDAVDAAVAEGWKADPQTRMLLPKKPEKPVEPVISSEQQLSRLTDFVSFLEN